MVTLGSRGQHGTDKLLVLRGEDCNRGVDGDTRTRCKSTSIRPLAFTTHFPFLDSPLDSHVYFQLLGFNGRRRKSVGGIRHPHHFGSRISRVLLDARDQVD